MSAVFRSLSVFSAQLVSSATRWLPSISPALPSFSLPSLPKLPPLAMPTMPEISLPQITLPRMPSVEGVFLNIARLYAGITSERHIVPKSLPMLAPGDLVVFVGKRRLELDGRYAQFLSNGLKKLHAEHVGVKIIVMPLIPGMLPKTLVFDFVPKEDGDFSKFNRDVQSKIQKNKLLPEEWAFVGVSRRSLKEIHTFNRKYGRMMEYSLGKSDCRDYASALVAFLTAEKVAPEHIAAYVNQSVKQGLGCLSKDVLRRYLMEHYHVDRNEQGALTVVQKKRHALPATSSDAAMNAA
jgi:hypothetical protein